MTDQKNELAKAVFTIAATKAKAKLGKNVQFAFAPSGDPQISVGGTQVLFRIRGGSVFGPISEGRELGKLISAEEISDLIANAIVNEISNPSRKG